MKKGSAGAFDPGGDLTSRPADDKGRSPESPADFAAFWPHYLAAHAHRRTRALHYGGTTLGLACLGLSLASGRAWLLPAALVAGYGPAWIGHALFERNRPATFTHPLWSFVGDFRMLWLAMRGRLGAEIARTRLDRRQGIE